PILIVEDVPNILEFLEVTLKFKGYNVVTATNGEDALEMVAREKPALVITDILMPKMDGYAFVFRLRADPLTAKLPIIFLSATYVTTEDKQFAFSLGAMRFVEKPIDTEELLLTVAEVLTQRRRAMTKPLNEKAFYQEYRKRLETKLRHKNSQMARTEQLLDNLPPEQRPVYESLLVEARRHRDAIQDELDELYRILEAFQ
ncbi:MAG: PleD family two-component system response regulator, partial [Anaerolineales bacterium]